jgi:hypothetical protein
MRRNSTASSTGDEVSLRRIDAYHYESRFKKDGKESGKSTRVISKDGRSMTYTAANGTVMVFDKQ